MYLCVYFSDSRGVSPTMIPELKVHLGDWLRLIPISKVFLTKDLASVSRYVNDDISMGYS